MSFKKKLTFLEKTFCPLYNGHKRIVKGKYQNTSQKKKDVKYPRHLLLIFKSPRVANSKAHPDILKMNNKNLGEIKNLIRLCFFVPYGLRFSAENRGSREIIL